MSLEKFKKHVLVIPKEQASFYRKKYIEQVDGFCYAGYLWKCLKTPNIVGFEYVLESVNKHGNTLAMWDR